MVLLLRNIISKNCYFFGYFNACYKREYIIHCARLFVKMTTALTVPSVTHPFLHSHFRTAVSSPKNKLKFFECLERWSADSKPEFSAKLGSINPASAETSDHPRRSGMVFTFGRYL